MVSFLLIETSNPCSHTGSDGHGVTAEPVGLVSIHAPTRGATCAAVHPE